MLRRPAVRIVTLSSHAPLFQFENFARSLALIVFFLFSLLYLEKGVLSDFASGVNKQFVCDRLRRESKS